MKKLSLCFVFFLGSFCLAFAQPGSPDDFLGYALGSRFTPHARILEYFKYMAEHEQQIKLIAYGKTYEDRDLTVAVISSPRNMKLLEQIRLNNIRLSKAQDAVSGIPQPAILWLSYNVHGNEPSSSETAMKMLYALTTGKTKEIVQWLENTIVIIDPCLNPDGRERYLDFFNSVSGSKPDVRPLAREHHEPWPGGRTNHYYFDLNRDWAWQTQLETQQRLRLYHDWMPEVHVDFHEQNYNEPYYFAPAAEPVHVDVTPWQRAFQVTVGKNNAKYFDQNGWQYFTKERFDLLYPSYGDTYPLYNGAIGMTYEQGGIDAGLAVITSAGDTLTLNERIQHHFVSGLATLEVVSKNAERLVQAFKKYFQSAVLDPPGKFRTYIVKGQDTIKMRRLTSFLTENGIEYAFGQQKAFKGYSYQTRKQERVEIERNDLVVNLHQPAAVLANVLFEPQTEIKDSNTYDITAWALPYTYGVQAYALKESVKGQYPSPDYKSSSPVGATFLPYAWVFRWGGIQGARMLTALQERGIRVRMAEEAFSAQGESFAKGSLLVYRAENEKSVKDLTDLMENQTENSQVNCFPLASGYVEIGKDLGSNVYPVLEKAKTAVLSGPGSSAQGLGEVWHFFEQELKERISVLEYESIESLDIREINVLIVPDGSFDDELSGKLENWVRQGGKLIVMEGAISPFIGKAPFTIKPKELGKDNLPAQLIRKFNSRDLSDLSNVIPGAIFKVDLDESHPLAFGLGDAYYVLKTDDKLYQPLEKGWNVGVLKPNGYRAGLVGAGAMKKLDAGLLFGVENIGGGCVIYLASDVLFRSFWENGKQMLLNAIFLVER